MKYTSLESAVTAVFGEGVRVADRQPVYGGDINRAYRLTLTDGSSVFLKCNGVKNVAFFQAEEAGLLALRRPGVIGTPQPLAVGVDEPKGIAFLLMDYLEAAPKRSDYWETFGRELALLHRAETAGLAAEDGSLRFGFREDNFIGATRQWNTPKASWVEFFRDCRLRPQIQMAERSLDAGMRARCERLLDRLDTYLPEPEFPSLLHGDLWSGNASCGPDGKAWIFDPAAYVGHYEAELAMTELFGRNPAAFYDAYHEVNPIDRGYEGRKDLYNLYHLFNHLNLFGSSYLSSVRRVLSRYA